MNAVGDSDGQIVRAFDFGIESFGQQNISALSNVEIVVLIAIHDVIPKSLAVFVFSLNVRDQISRLVAFGYIHRLLLRHNFRRMLGLLVNLHHSNSDRCRLGPLRIAIVFALNR